MLSSYNAFNERLSNGENNFIEGFGQHRAKQKSASPSKFRTTIADKSEILQQLISPGLERQASFNDEINLVDKLSTNNIGPNDIVLPQSNVSQETSFSNDCSIGLYGFINGALQ